MWLLLLGVILGSDFKANLQNENIYFYLVEREREMEGGMDGAVRERCKREHGDGWMDG